MSSSGSVVLDKKIFKWPHPIFVIISPLKRTWPLICKILNSLYLKDDLHQILLKLAFWFWRRRFLKVFGKFLLFRYYLPLGKASVLHLYNSESSLPKDDLCQLWLKLAQRFWRISWKCKSLTDRRQMDGRTDDGKKAIRKARLSFQLRWAKNDWNLLSWQYAHLLMIMKHCTQFQVPMISHLKGEVSTSYFKPSTPLGSTITERKIIGSSCPDNMHIY
jgi:hypothetical protein